jgi:hypothetical protein
MFTTEGTAFFAKPTKIFAAFGVTEEAKAVVASGVFEKFPDSKKTPDRMTITFTARMN